MTEQPTISIITPSFNQGNYIEETILSVLNQSYPNLEYVIIDGGSNDHTVEIIKKYESHLKYWISEPDSGQSHAINKGLKHCSGEIVNWLNSDDILMKGALHRIAEAFQNQNCDVVAGEEIHFSENQIDQYKTGTLIYPSLEETIFSGVIYQPSTYWKRNIFEQLSPINEALHFLMDADIWMKYLLKYGQSRITKINKPLVKFRLHENSKTVSLSKSFERERWLLRLELIKTIGKTPKHWEQFLSSFLTGLKYSSELQIDAALNLDKLHKLYALALLEHSYIFKDYDFSKRFLNDCFKSGMLNKRLIAYWVKLKLVPKYLLNAVRK